MTCPPRPGRSDLDRKPEWFPPRPLTSMEGGASGPAWSADGQRIAFSSENGIWTMNADGSALRQVARCEPERGHQSIVQISIGPKIAFSRFPGIWTVNVDGTDLRLLQHSDRRYERTRRRPVSPGELVASQALGTSSALAPSLPWSCARRCGSERPPGPRASSLRSSL